MHDRPLEGRRVVVTRAEAQAGELTMALRDAGAEVFEIPTIAMTAVREPEDDRLLAAVASYDGVLFTSPNAVTFAEARLRELGVSLASAPVFAIGAGTGQRISECFGVAPAVATTSTSEGLLELVTDALGAQLAEARFLFPRARSGRDVLIEGLRDEGARVDVVTLYETLPVATGPELPEHVDWLTFASPSAVSAFVQRFGPRQLAVACLGPVTARAARQAGLHVLAVAEEASADGLLRAMIDAQERL